MKKISVCTLEKVKWQMCFSFIYSGSPSLFYWQSVTILFHCFMGVCCIWTPGRCINRPPFSEYSFPFRVQSSPGNLRAYLFWKKSHFLLRSALPWCCCVLDKLPAAIFCCFMTKRVTKVHFCPHGISFQLCFCIFCFFFVFFCNCIRIFKYSISTVLLSALVWC